MYSGSRPESLRGRTIFALPWLGRSLIGTTDNNYDGELDHVQPAPEDIAYLLDAVNEFFDVGLGAHQRDFDSVECSREGYRVVEQAAVQFGDCRHGKAPGQPRFHHARTWSFGHDHQRALSRALPVGRIVVCLVRGLH